MGKYNIAWIRNIVCIFSLDHDITAIHCSSNYNKGVIWADTCIRLLVKTTAQSVIWADTKMFFSENHCIECDMGGYRYTSLSENISTCSCFLKQSLLNLSAHLAYTQQGGGGGVGPGAVVKAWLEIAGSSPALAFEFQVSSPLTRSVLLAQFSLHVHKCGLKPH